MLSIDKNIFTTARETGKPLLLDGAMGSMLQQKYRSKDNLWMSYLNIEKPKSVLKIHRDYIKAGADIITTNTFRTNPAALKGTDKITAGKMLPAAFEIAKAAVRNKATLIAGSNPPAEDCYKVERKLHSKELNANHVIHIKQLIFNGAHFILNETFSHLDEIILVCEYCSTNSIPYIISLYFNDHLELLSGEDLYSTVELVRKYAPMAIGFNCIKPEVFLQYFEGNDFNFNWGAYFNCGAGSVNDRSISCRIPPSEYTCYIRHLLSKRPSFIGACCGSSPAHIQEIRKVIDERTSD